MLPDGSEAIEALAKDGHTLDFVKNQYRHCKTILALGASAMLLEQLRISADLPSGKADPGLLVGTWGEGGVRVRMPSSPPWANIAIPPAMSIRL